MASSFNGQDIGLSRRRQGFNSPRNRHSPYGLKDRTNQASEATVMLKPISLLIKVNPSLCRKTNIFVELIFRQVICRLSLQVKIVAYHREISALVGRYADVAEQADARDLKPPEGNLVRVQLPSSAPFIYKTLTANFKV